MNTGGRYFKQPRDKSKFAPKKKVRDISSQTFLNLNTNFTKLHAVITVNGRIMFT